MNVNVLKNQSSNEVRALIKGFSSRYITDVNDFGNIVSSFGFVSSQTADHLRQLLRKWQACRPQAVRREVLPLLRHLNEDFRIIETLDVRNIRNADPDKIAAISRIWDSLIGQLCVNREIADIATSKAIHILTTGRIGPALDSNARKVLKIPRVYSSEEYLSLLFAVSEDIAAFEKANGILLEDLVPEKWQPVLVGRVYDMVIGPRNTKTKKTQQLQNVQSLQNVKPQRISFDNAFRLLQLKGPARVVSSRNTEYTVEAWTMRNGKQAIRAMPKSGIIYIHSDCWGNDITCQGTRAGGIYNGEDNIFKWLEKYGNL